MLTSLLPEICPKSPLDWDSSIIAGEPLDCAKLGPPVLQCRFLLVFHRNCGCAAFSDTSSLMEYLSNHPRVFRDYSFAIVCNNIHYPLLILGHRFDYIFNGLQDILSRFFENVEFSGFTWGQYCGEIRRRYLDAVRPLVLSKTNKLCWYCGRRVDCAFKSRGSNAFQVDHRQPTSGGGTDDLWNLFPACRTCNMRKGSKTLEEFRLWEANKRLTGFDLAETDGLIAGFRFWGERHPTFEPKLTTEAVQWLNEWKRIAGSIGYPEPLLTPADDR